MNRSSAADDVSWRQGAAIRVLVEKSAADLCPWLRGPCAWSQSAFSWTLRFPTERGRPWEEASRATRSVH